jgi:hypothetical protein
MAKVAKFTWGIWLTDDREWATLPPRLRKPTPYNCNLVPELLTVLGRLADEGHKPEMKLIPNDQLLQMRKDHR